MWSRAFLTQTVLYGCWSTLIVHQNYVTMLHYTGSTRHLRWFLQLGLMKKAEMFPILNFLAFTIFFIFDHCKELYLTFARLAMLQPCTSYLMNCLVFNVSTHFQRDNSQCWLHSLVQKHFIETKYHNVSLNGINSCSAASGNKHRMHLMAKHNFIVSFLLKSCSIALLKVFMYLNCILCSSRKDNNLYSSFHRFLLSHSLFSSFHMCSLEVCFKIKLM